MHVHLRQRTRHERGIRGAGEGQGGESGHRPGHKRPDTPRQNQLCGTEGVTIPNVELLVC